MEKRAILVLSAKHLSAETVNLLATKDTKKWPCVGGPYEGQGWFVYAHDENGVDDTFIPEDLFSVMQYAKAHDCSNILFDIEAEAIADLPEFSWEGFVFGKNFYERATDLIADSLEAWEGEEESVKEEHEELIAKLDAFLEEIRGQY